MANRVLALFSKMFSLGNQWKWMTSNLVQGVNKYQEHKRDRWLSDEEMERLWTILEKHASHLAYISHALPLFLHRVPF